MSVQYIFSIAGVFAVAHMSVHSIHSIHIPLAIWRDGLGEPKRRGTPPTTEWLEAPYKMVLKCILRKNNLKPYCGKYVCLKPLWRATFRFPGNFKTIVEVQNICETMGLHLIWQKKYQNISKPFCWFSSVFGKKSKPFCKASAHLWPYPEICSKPFCRVTKSCSNVYFF